MLQEKLRQLLRSHLAATGASALRITRNFGGLGDYGLRTKLASNVALTAVFDQPERNDQRPGRLELLERAARDLRACHREHAASERPSWPEMVFPNASEAARDPRHLILARIQQFLRALVDSGPFHQQVVMLRGRLVASARPLEKLEEAQLDLLFRQVTKAGEAAQGTAHGELLREGLYARGFWYRAVLIGFCEGAYSPDFVRHRCKMVTREIASLLAMLDDGPDKPAKEAPPP